MTKIEIRSQHISNNDVCLCNQYLKLVIINPKPGELILNR